MKHLIAAAIIFSCAGRASPELVGGGGFPAGTRITATSGDTPIEELRVGNRVLAFSEEELVQSEVRDFYSKKTMLISITTSHGKLTVARTHKLLTWKGFTEAQKIKTEDELAVLKNGRRRWAKIISIKPGRSGLVYNIETGPPHTFIANGFMVHNNGGTAGKETFGAAAPAPAAGIFYRLRQKLFSKKPEAR